MDEKFFFDNAPEMMAILSIGGQFLECNQECINVLGYSKEEFLNMESCYDIFTPESVPKALIARTYIIQGKPFKNIELKLIKKDRSIIDVLCNISAIEDKGDNCFRTLAVWRESTDLVQARKKLEEHNENMSLFIHTISHDLNGPLRRVNFLSTLLQENLNLNLTEESQKNCALMLKNLELLRYYFEDIRTYFMGSVFLVLEEVNTKTMIKNILSLISVPERFNVSIYSAMPTFKTLRIHLQQVLYNLISNAIYHHHNPESGSITITAQEIDHMYHFSITNNEEYLSVEDQEKIFKHLNCPLNKERLSMGLSIVKRILDQVGGALYISSECMGSNTFRFTWPTNYC